MDPLATTRDYLDALYGNEDTTLTKIRAHLRSNKLPSISIHPRIGRLLRLLVRIGGAKRILEIGTLGGISAVYLAQALPQDGYLLTIEKGAASAAVAKESLRMANVLDRAEIAVADALELLPKLDVEPFDLLYLDADKAEYPAYLDAALPLLRHGSVIVADDVLRRGKPMNPKFSDRTATGLRKFNEMLAFDPRFECLILPDIADYSWGGLDGVSIGILN